MSGCWIVAEAYAVTTPHHAHLMAVWIGRRRRREVSVFSLALLLFRRTPLGVE